MYSLTILCSEYVMGAKWDLVPHNKYCEGVKKFSITIWNLHMFNGREKKEKNKGND